MNLIEPSDRICDELISNGWTVLDHFFEPDLIVQLNAECRQQHRQGLLKNAGTGRAAQFAVQQSLRSDQIRWLEPGMSQAVDRYLAQMNGLREFFNRQLYLGLQEFENHFAFYAPGAFYQKHLDRFQHEDSRVLTSVLYLNPVWKPGDGGELRLHLENGARDIEPVANRLVLFISEQILHEVIPTGVERLSLTGWFKRNAFNGKLD